MTGSGNWTYFLPGAAPVLIDAGVGHERHLQAIQSHAPAGPEHVVVTHSHSDHIAGASVIAAQWPSTRFSKFLWPERDARFGVAWWPLADGHAIPAGDSELQVIHTPGHAPDHVALWHEETRTLFSGDLVVLGTTVVIPASMGGSLKAYLQSLERVLALRPSRLLPAHGPAVDEPERIIGQYIAHRQEREQQVRDALRDGKRTADAIVQHIYVGLTEALVPMARESVLAHLFKLRDDGQAGEREGEWYARP
jgi:glyoxylase-like metal-dependent hydrolase (beta-lactamase superfamily II)